MLEYRSCFEAHLSMQIKHEHDLYSCKYKVNKLFTHDIGNQTSTIPSDCQTTLRL